MNANQCAHALTRPTTRATSDVAVTIAMQTGPIATQQQCQPYQHYVLEHMQSTHPAAVARDARAEMSPPLCALGDLANMYVRPQPDTHIDRM